MYYQFPYTTIAPDTIREIVMQMCRHANNPVGSRGCAKQGKHSFALFLIFIIIVLYPTLLYITVSPFHLLPPTIYVVLFYGFFMLAPCHGWSEQSLSFCRHNKILGKLRAKKKEKKFFFLLVPPNRKKNLLLFFIQLRLHLSQNK